MVDSVRQHGRSKVCLRLVAVALTLVIATLGVSACGSSSSKTASPAEPSNLLKAAEISHYADGTVQHAFLEFWSDLQFQSWADAAAFYSPSLRKFIGTARIIAGKKLNASVYPLMKPEIQRVNQHGDEATIYYTVRLTTGSKELDSIALKKEVGNWQIVYDSRLDPELAQQAQNSTELEVNGSLPTDPTQKPSKAAARAANEAAQLQARYQQQVLNSQH